MEEIKEKYANFQGYNSWNAFVANLESADELSVHVDIMSLYRTNKRNPLPQTKEKVAYWTGDRLSCLKVFRLLTKHGENIFKTTSEWLLRAEAKYNYVIFQEDQWLGYDDLDLEIFKPNGEIIMREFNLIEL